MPPHVTRIYTAGGRLANISFQQRHHDPVDRREHHKVTVSHPNQSVVKIGVNTYIKHSYDQVVRVLVHQLKLHEKEQL